MALFVFGSLQETSFDRFAIGILGVCASLIASLSALLTIAFTESRENKTLKTNTNRGVTTG